MNQPSDPTRTPVIWGAGALILLVLCCVGTTLIAGGVAAGLLGTLGLWLSNPWLIATAVAIAAAGVLYVIGRGRERGDRCPPGTGTTHDPEPRKEH